jgi:hypothetical protein
MAAVGRRSGDKGRLDRRFERAAGSGPWHKRLSKIVRIIGTWQGCVKNGTEITDYHQGAVSP